MKLEKKYIIEKWTEWNTILSNAIDDFKTVYSLVPNILEANNHTYSQIDFLTNVVPGEKDNLIRKDEKTNQCHKPGENEEVKISAFTNDISSIDFALDVNMPDKEFKLIYDSKPDWGDDDVDNNPVDREKKLITILNN